MFADLLSIHAAGRRTRNTSPSSRGPSACWSAARLLPSARAGAPASRAWTQAQRRDPFKTEVARTVPSRRTPCWPCTRGAARRPTQPRGATPKRRGPVRCRRRHKGPGNNHPDAVAPSGRQEVTGLAWMQREPSLVRLPCPRRRRMGPQRCPLRSPADAATPRRPKRARKPTPAPSRAPTVSYDDLGGIEGVLDDIRELIEYPLAHPEVCSAVQEVASPRMAANIYRSSSCGHLAGAVHPGPVPCPCFATLQPFSSCLSRRFTNGSAWPHREGSSSVAPPAVARRPWPTPSPTSAGSRCSRYPRRRSCRECRGSPRPSSGERVCVCWGHEPDDAAGTRGVMWGCALIGTWKTHQT